MNEKFTLKKANLYIDKIYSSLGDCEVLVQLAEEASELAQAALKLRRAINNENPTPLSTDEALANFSEEILDVEACLCVLGVHKLEFASDKMLYKLKRWHSRLKLKKK